MSDSRLRYRLAWWAPSYPGLPARRRAARVRLAWPARFARLVALLALGVTALGAAVLVGVFVLLPALPVAIPPPRAPAVARSTHVYAADGSLIVTLHGEINREPVPLGRISRHLQVAAAAAEDARFFDHGALDLRSIGRAALANLQAGRAVQGGSTITQQYVKYAYVGGERSLKRKIREAAIALRLERRMSKRQILERYLNTVYFGRGAYGAEAAAKTYFSKPAFELSVSESALLVGLIHAPDRYSPDASPSRAEARRRWVIVRMEQLGFLTPEAAESARSDRPRLAPPEASPERFPWFLDALRRYLFFRYGVDKVLAGGLEVHTTIDPQLQQAAEGSLARALPTPGDPYAALVSVEPETGYVRALVGGRDPASERYNIAIQGRRQPGSAFKPFVLVAALEHGMTARSGVSGATLEQATVHSINRAYMRLVRTVGPETVVEVAERMGLPGPAWIPQQVGCRPRGSEICRTLIQPFPALALGSEEVTPLEMASAFSTLADHGIYREPKLVSRVADASGRVLEGGPAAPVQAISPAVAAAATDILQGVITRGTGRRAQIGRPAAGKTGTSQDFANAWFVGYTPELSTAVWVGYRDANRPLLNVEGVARVAGGTIPATIWGDYMSLADLRVAATSGGGSVLLGGDVTTTLTVENRGPWSAAKVVLTERIPTGVRVVSAHPEQGACSASRLLVRCQLGQLPRGSASRVTLVLRPTASGTLTIASDVRGAGSDPEASNNAASLDVRVDPAADLSVVKTTPGRQVLVGQDLTYAVVIRNAGPSPANEVTVTDPLPPGVDLVSARSPAGGCSDVGGQVSCRIDRLARGTVARISIVGRATRAGEFLNAARVGAREADPVPSNNLASAKRAVAPLADLSVSQEVPPEPVLQGGELTVVVIVANQGPSPATGVRLTNPLPPAVELRAAHLDRGSCSEAQRVVSCSIGELAENSVARTTFVLRPLRTGRVTNRASVAANETDLTRRNNSSRATLRVAPAADLSIAATASPEVPGGEELGYVLTVANAGPATARGVTVIAQLPRGARLARVSSRRACVPSADHVVCRVRSLAAGASTSFTVVVRPGPAGPMVMVAATSGRLADPDLANNRAEVVAFATPQGPQAPAGEGSARAPPSPEA